MESHHWKSKESLNWGVEKSQHCELVEVDRYQNRIVHVAKTVTGPGLEMLVGRLETLIKADQGLPEVGSLAL